MDYGGCDAVFVIVTVQLIFPTGDVTRPFSMLGLGDIVIPGAHSAMKPALHRSISLASVTA